MSTEEMPTATVPDIDRCFQKYISEKTFSAGACVASVGGAIFHRGVYGDTVSPPPRTPVEFDTVFDLASLTKPLATGLVALFLAGRNRIDLSAPLSRTIDIFKDPRFDAVTLDMLLDHSAGFPDCVPFWDAMKSQGRQSVCGTQGAMSALKDQVAELPFANPPGTATVYSDVGFLALGWVLEGIIGKPLDVFLEREIFRPLGLHEDLFFVRIDDMKQRQALRRRIFVATEDCPERGKLIQGEVHDPTAWCAGGVCGHAGLFGTVDAVWQLMRVLWECHQGEGSFFHPGTVRKFFTRSKRLKETTRTLAWDTPSAQNSTAGKRFSRTSVGHLGFTGTSVWMDLKTGVTGVVLTNSVHPTYEGKREAMKVFRPRVYELIAKSGESAGPAPGESGATGAAAFGR